MKIYKNLHVVAFVAAMMALGAQAVEVSPEQVQAAVAAWTSANGAAFTSLGTAMEPSAVRDDDGRVLYWVVPMSNGGAVIASPDSDLDLVISVLEKYEGSFPAGHPLPSILKYDMRNRLDALAQYYAGSGSSGRRLLGASAGGSESNEALAQAISAARAQWAKYGVGSGRRPLLGASELTGGDASPFVRRIVDGFEENGRFTHWNQGSVGGSLCYNKYTPNNYVCGCVATAGAAILQAFNCTNDPGSVKGSPTVGANGAALPDKYSITIPGKTDWSLLPDYEGRTDAGQPIWKGGLTDEGRNLLGRVAFNVGVLVDMNWANDGSGAYTSSLTNAFHRYGFTTSRYVAYSGDEESDGTEFFKTLYAQLWCGAPAVLSIHGAPGGHAVVACGYARDPDGDEFCRVFMGWGGSSDAWYKLPAIKSYTIVVGAVTMIGYEDDAVVPVYGETNIPGAEFTVPGYVTNGVAVTVTVNENGYFGIRVPIGLADKTITYAPRNRSVTIAPFDSDVIADEYAKPDALSDALPEEIFFPLLNMTSKNTMETGKAVANDQGKALLIVSGSSDFWATKMLTEYLYYLDDTTDISNKFVYVFVKNRSSNPDEPDGNPSIAVFDPAVFEAENRWEESNGRLDYENFITDDGAYTFSADDAESMTNRVDALLADGYDRYLRCHSGITLKIQGASPANVNPGEMTYIYGTNTNTCVSVTLENAWTNGETVALAAFGTITNETQGIIYSCVGWTTNKVSGAASLKTFTAGSETELQLFSGDDVTITWIWDVTHYRVTASSTVPYSVNGSGDAVTPALSWVAAGDIATISAEPTVGAYHFTEWRVTGLKKGDYDDELYENGTKVSFIVSEPMTVKAKYSNGASGAPEAVENTVVFESIPADAAEKVALPVAGAYVWGENKTMDGLFTVDTSVSYTDADGNEWVFSSFDFKPSYSAVHLDDTSFKLNSSSATVTLTWVRKESPTPPTPPTPGPTPGDISITGIAKDASGKWVITIDGAVKGCWYWLYGSNDLTAFSGTTWTASKAVTDEANPQQATANGEVVFHATANGDSHFWRAKASSTETGN